MRPLFRQTGLSMRVLRPNLLLYMGTTKRTPLEIKFQWHCVTLSNAAALNQRDDKKFYEDISDWRIQIRLTRSKQSLEKGVWKDKLLFLMPPQFYLLKFFFKKYKNNQIKSGKHRREPRLFQNWELLGPLLLLSLNSLDQVFGQMVLSKRGFGICPFNNWN